MSVLIGQRADTVRMEKQDWLWPDRIPCGKVTLFAGKPDCGKSLATLNVIARVTNGSDWPDGTKGEAPREVLLAATEDDLATTLVPRLKAAGADLTKVHLIKRVIVEGKSKTIKRILQLKEDALLIKRLLRDHPQVALIVLDPLTGYFGEVDPNKDKEIRPVMEAMTNAIEQSKTAVVGIIHHNKRSDVDALGKILGGSAVAGVSRAVWGFSRDTENKDEFFMALVKSNLSKKRTGMKYKIGESEVKLGDGSTAQVPFTEWLGETELDANEVLGQERDTKGRKDNKQITLAKEFLGRYVTSGKSRMARDLYAECEKQGISVATLKQAKNEFPETKSVQLTNGWMWRITTSAVSEKTVDTAEIRVEDVL